MSRPNEYDIPNEITDLFVEVTAMGNLRDAYIKRPFGFKKARKCSISMEVAERKAWKMFAELHPNAPLEGLQYQCRINRVVVLEVRNEQG
jgi:hypothetical protein